MKGTLNTNTEWLQTNDIGGFASGSVFGPPTRRYHGLLCASLNPPTERVMLVSHLVETVQVGEQVLPLSTEHYLRHRPETEAQVNSFINRPYARWQYELKETQIEKSVLMLKEENTTLVRYTNTGKESLTLFIKPLLALRDFHHLRTESTSVETRIEGNTVKVQSPEMPTVFLSASVATWQAKADWYHELYYHEEANRGFDATEDNFLPAELNCTLGRNESLILRLSTLPGVVTQKPFIEADKKHLLELKADSFLNDLKEAAQQFIVHRESTSGPTILAGYPWFSDWGRDTLIALRDFQDFMSPGETQAVIRTFLHYQKDGLIPNRFPDNPDDAIEYNTADATLWLFVALWETQQKTPDVDFLRTVFADLTLILETHIEGTHFNIGLQANGLMSQGEAPWQLTWMDAKIGDFTVTPRQGLAVEINALWYNALKIYQSFQRTLKDKSLSVADPIKRFEKSFVETFWRADDLGLYDVISKDGTPDLVVRPNQVYALSLPFVVLPKSKQKIVLQQLGEKLYTPFGLRTLSADDAGFVPEYKGTPLQRDSAYHQGTVWPFLLRDYWVAYEKINGKRKTKLQLKTEIESLKHHFYFEAGVNSVSEVFDGLRPEYGKGTPQQAWSVAALCKMQKMMDD